MAKYICLNCSKEYTSSKKSSKFCSLECKHQYNRIDYNCDYCGKLVNTLSFTETNMKSYFLVKEREFIVLKSVQIKHIHIK